MDNALLDICHSKGYNTDKYYRPDGTDWDPTITNGAGHCFVEKFYEKHFSKRRDSKTLLEIGTYRGGSAFLWRDYFPNATISTADLYYAEALKDQERVIQLIGDAYSDPFIDSLKDNYYDIIIDDGSHLLHHVEIFVQKYPAKLKHNGVLVVEDIREIEWTYRLMELLPDELRKYTTIYDLRTVNGRFDDIAIVIDRG